MEQNDFLRKALEHWKQQRQKRFEEMLAELAALDTTIRQHQVQLGEPMEDLPPLPTGHGSKLLADTKTPSSRIVGIGEYKPRPDEFFGKSQAEAAREYLDRIGHAMSLDDILHAITSGGCKVGGAEPKRTLLVTLSQGKRDFVNTGGGNWGLRRFYPNMPKLGRPEATIPRKKKVAKPRSKAPAKRDTKISTIKPKAQKPIVEVGQSAKDDQNSVVQ